MPRTLQNWRRGPRSSFSLGPEHGVYALFLRDGAQLPGITPGERGLLYIGLAANRLGLKGRCHFDAQTRNHSPRKSLAVLLLDELALTPILIPKPNSSNTWGLDATSEARLSAWMHANLELAIAPCDDPDARETELVGHYAPPLNLKKCTQSPQHLRIAAARAAIKASVKGPTETAKPPHDRCFVEASRAQPVSQTFPRTTQISAASRKLPVGAEIDTAEAIAARYRLNPKSYRQQLRGTISWYRKPQDWTFPVGSREWKDMIRVAEAMVG